MPQPPAPAQGVHLLGGFLAQRTSPIDSGGPLKEVHEFSGGGAGHLVTGDPPKEKIAATLTAWAPFGLFEPHETIPVTKSLELALAVAKPRAAAIQT